MEDWMLWQNTADEKNIEIVIHCIENIITKRDINISFIVEHNNIILGESDQKLIKSEAEDESPVYRIDFVVNLPLVPIDKESYKAIISVPVLIKVVQCSDYEREEESTVSTNEPKKKSIFSAKSATVPSPVLLGTCNFDLIPLALGEENFTEKIILETPTFSFDGDSVSWQNLPRLTVTAIQNSPPFFEENETTNILNITVESIYNLPPAFTNNANYSAGTIAFSENEVPERIIFTHGSWTKYRDVERTKRWNTLRYINNRAQLSKYKLDYDFEGVRNEVKEKFDLSKKACEDIPRIEWNAMYRCVVWKEGIESIKHHINKYKYWPFQIQVKDGAVPVKSKGNTSFSTQIYQCYVDVSELLFPGRRRCRIVGQLYEYNPADITEKVGIEENIFVLEPLRKEGKERKSKSSKHTQSTTSEIEMISQPITAENGEPTVIAIEIELLEPLIPCRVEEDFSHLIKEILPKLEKKSHSIYSANVAEEQYVNCVKRLAEVLTECYRDFCEKNKGKFSGKENPEEKYCFDPESDEITCFTQYLYKTGAYLSVRSALKMKLPMLIDQKFEMPKNLIDSHETQNMISSVYTYLVEQMHIALNTMVEGRETKEFQSEVDLQMIDFYAEEAYEFGDLDVAKQHYSKAITSNKVNPDLWAKYAIFLRNIGDVEHAKECCLEALALDSKCAIALLSYGMILFDNREYRQAEIFFRAITNFYPQFCEGWAILHLFYIRTDYYPGVDLTYRIAEKCMRHKSHAISLDHKTLSWTITHCPRNNLYMTVAIFLLKLKFCEFAGIAIAQEMGNSKRSTHVLYYMAVEHYLSGRYEDALSHLNEAKCDYGMDCAISCLTGHCYFKIGEIEKAVECYEFARMLFDRPAELYLEEIRLGYYYYNAGDYERAKTMFLSVCNTSPSSLAWMGVGTSYYELNEFYEAELALLEANRLDNHNPEVWSYLCLLNMTLRRYDEFSQCYSELLKYQNNLRDRKLWLRVTDMMEALDYTPPNVTEPDLTEDYSTEESGEQLKN